MRALETLRQLSAAIAGRPCERTDWTAVVELANAHLLTPQLHAALTHAGEVARLPPEISAFVADAFARNRERNRRLFSQLSDAVAALNGVGLEPVLLKGAALWATLGRPTEFDRMSRDLDLLVEPSAAPLALETLAAAGFHVLASYDEPWRHVVAELGRPQDVGVIDLHRRPPGPLQSARTPHRLQQVAWDGLSALTPAPAAQVFMLAMHDQFHEGSYWRGLPPLRHLLDIAALAPQVDWAALDRLSGERLTRRAVAVEVAAAQSFAGAPRIWTPAESTGARLHHARQLVQFAYPATAWPLACLAALSEAGSLIGHRRLVGDGPGGLLDRFARFRSLARTADDAGRGVCADRVVGADCLHPPEPNDATRATFWRQHGAR